jgi:hypothetical protein
MADLKSPEPSFERVLVGRHEAEELLGTNIHNRNIRDRRVRNYAIDMVTGKWLEVGEAIKFAKDGTMLDGQHRLLALIKATGSEPIRLGVHEYKPIKDLKIWFNVVRGLDKHSQRAMDIGAGRSLADVLQLEYGETSTHNLAAILRIIHSWQSGYRKQIAKRELATNATILAFYEQDPDTFRHLVNVVKAEHRRIPLAPTVLALSHYILEERDAEDAQVFFDRLADGQGLFKGDPIYELRERLKDLQNERGSGHRYVAYTLALVIKAWNAFRANEKLNVLSFKMGGAHPENFPEPM